MSAPSCLVFFGVRYELAPEELEQVETRTDERITRARSARLDHYLGNFAADNGEKWLLFIGKQLANTGPELGMCVELRSDQLQGLVAEASQKLASAGWREPARLFVQYQPD
jgi:hypothetical protein